jgi:hypothetical protein
MRSMEHPTIIVRADWDDDAQVWVATTADIDGLATEAPTLEKLRARVAIMVAELIELNGQPTGR